MKIAISSTGSTLDDEVDPRFGRCQYFIIADLETMETESLNNANVMAAGGAGISTAQMIVNKGIGAVLTGNCGPNAYQVLSAAGVQIITGASGKVKDAIEKFKGGTFKTAPEANVVDHFGMGGGIATGAGAGMGRGGGRGMGRGIGRGMGMGVTMGAGMGSAASPAAQPEEPEEEIAALKDQTQMLTKQIADIQRRIEELNNSRRK
jgi:predicted Fe-Mo cluster-binding NifX family protein